MVVVPEWRMEVWELGALLRCHDIVQDTGVDPVSGTDWFLGSDCGHSSANGPAGSDRDVPAFEHPRPSVFCVSEHPRWLQSPSPIRLDILSTDFCTGCLYRLTRGRETAQVSASLLGNEETQHCCATGFHTSRSQCCIISVKRLYNYPDHDGVEYLQQIEPVDKIAYAYHVYYMEPAKNPSYQSNIRREPNSAELEVNRENAAAPPKADDDQG